MQHCRPDQESTPKLVDACSRDAMSDDKPLAANVRATSLEVQDHNHRARKTYAAAGFSSNSHEGLTIYLTKEL